MDHMVKCGWLLIGTVIKATTLQIQVRKIRASHLVIYLFIFVFLTFISKIIADWLIIAMQAFLMKTCSF